ncbi:microsomal glutathione s-transferase [Niveomyces insectorum RCEF 264]|uniref:Microsomal glutathione s-transferase n=1 Tax=Niveomyces insectorum RCEF 264 TaxID=1081102 RepID=A0A162MNJ2_9HYPO|nr:microsomal glutathione s-transferase [Niveomyces insectorum RCEF 264]
MSSLVSLQVPVEYGYVLGAATAACFVNAYHGILTGAARRAAKVPYPVAYATAEAAEKDPAVFKFNCAQKVHSNFTENFSPFIVELLISGLRFPLASAALGAGWVVSRILFARGYVNSGPTGRHIGAPHALFDFVLKFMSGYTAYTFLCPQ